MPKNSTKNQLRGTSSGAEFSPYMYPYACARIMRAGMCVCARLRALSSRGRTKRRVPGANVKRLAPALRVTVSSTPTGIGPLRAINANKEKNPGLLIFKKNILNLDL